MGNKHLLPQESLCVCAAADGTAAGATLRRPIGDKGLPRGERRPTRFIVSKYPAESAAATPSRQAVIDPLQMGDCCYP